jgi:energy-converting hydrogenase Eha subunit A
MPPYLPAQRADASLFINVSWIALTSCTLSVQSVRVSDALPLAVAAEVRAEMARQRVSQQPIADALGISRQALSRRMTGEIPFDVAELESIAGFLGVPVSRFWPAVAANS